MCQYLRVCSNNTGHKSGRRWSLSARLLRSRRRRRSAHASPEAVIKTKQERALIRKSVCRSAHSVKLRQTWAHFGTGASMESGCDFNLLIYLRRIGVYGSDVVRCVVEHDRSADVLLQAFDWNAPLSIWSTTSDCFLFISCGTCSDCVCVYLRIRDSLVVRRMMTAPETKNRK